MPEQPIGVQRRMMELGRIRLGQKGPKGEPKKLSKFRLTSASKVLLEAAAGLYGGTVREWKDAPDEGYFELLTTSDTLDIILPPVFSDRDGSPTAPYSQVYELWSGGGCQRRCDGETELLSGKPCQCDADDRKCKITTRVSVILPNVPGLGVWRLESHGWNAASLLPGTLDLLIMAASEQKFIPAVLRLEQRTSKKGGTTRKFVVPVIDLPQLRMGELAGVIADAAGLPAINAPASSRLPRPALPAAPALPTDATFEHEVLPGHGAPPPIPKPEVIDVAAKKEAELFEMVDKLGAGEDTRKACEKNRKKWADDRSSYLDWLERCIEAAKKNLAETQPPEQSLFEGMVPESAKGAK